MSSLLLRAGLAAALVGVAIGPIVACREPTQIIVRVETDLTCGIGGANLSNVVVSAGADVVQKPLAGPCTDGLVGTVAIVPGPSAETVEIVVVGAIGDASCDVHAVNGGSCIVAKRKLSFVDHFTLPITIRLEAECSGVDCPDQQSCQGGKCVPNGCTGTPSACLDAGVTDAGSPPTVTALSAGGDSTCATLSNADVVCWGDSPNGKLFGNGAQTPKVVPQLHGAKSIVLGRAHGCAIFPGDANTTQVRCWGANARGQSGVKGSTLDVTTPNAILDAQAQPLKNATALTAGADFTCAITASGTVACWGADDRLQLGQGQADSPVAFPVPSVVSAKSIAAGANHVCASASITGATCPVLCNVVCWGDNGAGQCASTNGGTTAPRTVQLPSSTMVAGGDRSLAFNPNLVFYWGTGIKGMATFPTTATPTKIGDVGLNAKLMSSGVDHVCAVNATSTVGCVADDPNFSKNVVAKATALVSGAHHACVITGAGNILCWGKNDQVQLGAKGATSPHRVDLP